MKQNGTNPVLHFIAHLKFPDRTWQEHLNLSTVVALKLIIFYTRNIFVFIDNKIKSENSKQ